MAFFHQFSFLRRNEKNLCMMMCDKPVMLTLTRCYVSARLPRLLFAPQLQRTWVAAASTEAGMRPAAPAPPVDGKQKQE